MKPVLRKNHSQKEFTFHHDFMEFLNIGTFLEHRNKNFPRYKNHLKNENANFSILLISKGARL